MSAPTCRRCDVLAVAVFRFSHGCYCDATPVQALCLHHAFKSGPPSGGTMELIEDLTIDSSFTEVFMSYPSPSHATADLGMAGGPVHIGPPCNVAGPKPIDSKSEVGKAVGLIDALLAVAGALCERKRPWEDQAVQEALCDLRDDTAVRALMDEAARASRSPFR